MRWSVAMEPATAMVPGMGGSPGWDGSEDDGGAPVDEHPVLAVPADGAGEHGALDVGARAGEIGDACAVRDPHHVLLDDRALVEVLGGVVGGGADELHAPLLGPLVGTGA